MTYEAAQERIKNSPLAKFDLNIFSRGAEIEEVPVSPSTIPPVQLDSPSSCSSIDCDDPAKQVHFIKVDSPIEMSGFKIIKPL